MQTWMDAEVLAVNDVEYDPSVKGYATDCLVHLNDGLDGLCVVRTYDNDADGTHIRWIIGRMRKPDDLELLLHCFNQPYHGRHCLPTD